MSNLPTELMDLIRIVGGFNGPLAEQIENYFNREFQNSYYHKRDREQWLKQTGALKAILNCNTAREAKRIARDALGR